MKPILAIDPGASGGLAWQDLDGVQTCPMPATEGEVCDKLRSICLRPGTVACVEDVGGWGMPGPRGFTFGRGFGFILGVLQTIGVPVILVRPAKWQKFLSLGTVKSAGGKKPWKLKLMSEAQRRFPACEVTLKTADALLLLDYASAQNGGRVTEGSYGPDVNVPQSQDMRPVR